MNTLKLVFSVLLLSSSFSYAADEIHWTIMGQSAVTFDWRGSSSENTIRYGSKSGEYTQSVTGFAPSPFPFSSKGPFWEAKIIGLKENTRYFYSIANGPEATFKTPPVRGDSGFTIFVEGDIGDTGSYFRVGAVQDLIANGKPDFVVGLGDLTYGNAHGQEAVDQHFNDVMVWSRDAAYMPVWGNHEWDVPANDDLRNYKGRFDLPNSQTSPNSPDISCCGEDWYWFDYGNVRFIALPEPWSGAWFDWNTHAKLLMTEAQADADITFIVTFVHRPAYSSAHHPGSFKLKEILDNLGQRFSKYVLNVNGHSHNYERTHPQNGVVHVTAGASGSGLQADGTCLWLICDKPSWSAFRAMHVGAVKFEFSANGIEGTFICGPAGAGKNDIECNSGDIIDRFSIGNPTPIVDPAPEAISGTSVPVVSVTGTLMFSPTDDASIKRDNPTRNYGATKLETDKRNLEHFLMKFNISGLNGHTVTSAKLRLYNINGSDKGGDFYRVADNSWSESSVTWNNAPDADSSAIAKLGAVATKEWFEVDLSSAIKADGVYSFRVISTSSNGADYLSKEDDSHAPQLIVTYTNTVADSGDDAPVPVEKKATDPVDNPTDNKPDTESSDNKVAIPLEPVSLTFTPTDDATIKPESPTSNYGSKYLATDKSSVEHFLMKFNVSGINGGTVSAAKLRLYNINGSDKGGDFYRVTDNSWSESSVTWNSAPDADSSTIVSLGKVSVGHWVEVDLSSEITADGIYSFRVSSTSTNGADYKSSEAGDYAPQLIVTFNKVAAISDIDAAPANFKATPLSTSEMALSWSASTDNTGVSHYKVYRDALEIDNTDKNSCSDSGLTPATTYIYTVVAIDEAGNVLGKSITTTITDAIEPEPEPESDPDLEVIASGSLTFIPTDDASINPGYPTRNYGTAKLETDKSSIENFLMKFNVSGVDGYTVSSVKLRLYNVNGSDKGGDFYRVADSDWSESTVTWNNAPEAGSTAITTLGKVSVSEWVEVDLSSEIKADGIYSLRVSSTSSNGADYKSKEAGEFAPQLIVTFNGTTTYDFSVEDDFSTPISAPKSIIDPIVPSNLETNFTLITDATQVFLVPKMVMPAYLSPMTDPVFGTQIIRIADDAGSSLNSVSGVWGHDVRHHYSKDQPWNSDGSLLAIQNKNYSSQLILDGSTYQPIKGKCSNYSLKDDRWHPSLLHPHERINAHSNKLEWFDVMRCEQTRSWNLPIDVNYLGSGEGNTSNDGRYVLLSDASRMFIVDMDPQAPFASYENGNKRIGPMIKLSDCGLSDCRIDWVSISASGKYAVVSYEGDHPRVYDVNMVTLELTPRSMPSNSAQCSGHDPAKGYIFDLGHADMALNPFDNNEDVLIGQRRSWCPRTVNGTEMGSVIMVRLRDNKITTLTNPSNEASAHHISTRNLDRPGMVYVSYHVYSTERIFNDEIVAIKMDGSQVVERLAHKHTDTTGCYRCESHAVPSRDGKRVLFAMADPGSSTDIKPYIVDTRF